MSSEDEGMGPFTIAILILATLFLIGLLGWGVRACNTAQKATFDGLDQNLDRQNFEKSQSYREGLRRDFDELMLAYSAAKSDDERTVILSTLRHRVQGAPPEAVPQDVKDFLAQHSH